MESVIRGVAAETSAVLLKRWWQGMAVVSNAHEYYYYDRL